jgi:prepilin-type N-terminal cleavage/methylation domain-containing protein
MVSAVRRGFSLHELLISLTVMSAVFGLATHFAMRQMRFFRDVADADARRSQLAQVTEVVRNVLANVSPSTGEFLVAQDSALEVRLTIGTAFVCDAAPGRVLLPAPDRSAGRMAAFVRTPAAGDRLSALFSDSLGETWLHLQLASAPAAEGPCPSNPVIDTTWRITTVEPMVLPIGTALRFTRPLRLSIYRSSDDRWYLGARDWNGGGQRFNAIQPVAGPLLRFDNTASAGLRFIYGDAQGQTLSQPVAVDRIASVTVVARASSDSMVAVVRLPNAQ